MRILSLLLLGALLSSPAGAQTEGTLAHLNPVSREVTLLVGTQLQTFTADPVQFGKLSAQGVSSRWRVFTRDRKLTSILSVGQDATAAQALQALQRFAGFVNAGQFNQAFLLQSAGQKKREPEKIFLANYNHRYLSIRPEDVKLAEVTPARVLFHVRVSLAGDNEMPGILHLPFVPEAGGWVLDGCSYFDREKDPLKF